MYMYISDFNHSVLSTNQVLAVPDLSSRDPAKQAASWHACYTWVQRDSERFRILSKGTEQGPRVKARTSRLQSPCSETLISLLLRQAVSSCVLIPGTSTLGWHSGLGRENTQKQPEHQPGLEGLSSSRGSNLQKWQLDLPFVAPEQTRCWWRMNGTIPFSTSHHLPLHLGEKQPGAQPLGPSTFAGLIQLGQYRICLQCGRPGLNPQVRKTRWRRAWQPTPVFLPEYPTDRGAWRAVGSQRVGHNLEANINTSVLNQSGQGSGDID